MSFLRHIPSWLKNKYLLTGVGFWCGLSFFDDRDLINNLHHRQEQKELEMSRDQYLGQIKATKEELEQLKKNPALLEKYAREKYRMKKDNEDLFIVTE
ncbi:MAG: septum formation initiator family protein [Chitinophagaceae bacterium]|nr:septum formation initiator family protein [Chitinophagaceae bacterium]